jgi:hypothetical protein
MSERLKEMWLNRQKSNCVRRTTHLVLLIVLSFLGSLPLIASAQTTFHVSERVTMKQDEDVAQLWNLTLTPAAEPRPALKYLLRPPYHMQQPGNATPYYYRALLMDAELPAAVWKQWSAEYDKWFDCKEVPLDEMHDWLDKHQQIYNELKTATYRERLDIDLRFRDLEGMKTIAFLLPDAQRMRSLARMLVVKVRVEITEGRIDDAVETLRVGYRLAEATAKTPTLLNDLVGLAIGSMMTAELTHLVAHPDAPNMYWAIASLPHPVIDMRDGMDWESGVPWQVFPFLRDPETAVRSPQEWRDMLMGAMLNVSQLSNYPRKPASLGELSATAMMMKAYPLAKRALVVDGMEREQVEAMPVGQILAIQTAKRIRHAYDETFKWSYISSGRTYQQWVAAERRIHSERRLGRGHAADGALPIAGVLLPGLTHAWFASLRLERQLAVVRTIEAIRMYAVSHDGRLPPSLDAIKEVPVPNDPLFEKPFEYRVEGDEGILETRPRSEGLERIDVYRYVLRIAK